MTAPKQKLSMRLLDMDYAAESGRIAEKIREILAQKLKRKGLVIAISGGIDSSVCAALSVLAVGKDRVYGLLLPERDSAGQSTERGRQLATHLGIDFEVFDIGATLEAIGCYEQRDNAIRSIFPQYDAGWSNKIAIRGGVTGGLNYFVLVVQSPEGEMYEARLPLKEYLQIVAATNFKQRIRKTMEYFHADKRNFAVVGTPNRLEYDQGFFVKNGDGSADLKPIAHLYKSQVYAMARFLRLPDEICNAKPTTDTYSLEQGQDEFYFALPYAQMDLALWALNNGYSASEFAEASEIDDATAEYVFKDIATKRKTTRYLQSKAILIEDVVEIDW